MSPRHYLFDVMWNSDVTLADDVALNASPVEVTIGPNPQQAQPTPLTMQSLQTTIVEEPTWPNSQPAQPTPSKGLALSLVKQKGLAQIQISISLYADISIVFRFKSRRKNKSKGNEKKKDEIFVWIVKF